VSRIEIPVQHQILWNTGDVKLWSEVELWLKTSAGGWLPEAFQVDTGSDLTTFPAYDAKRMGLPLPIAPSPVTHQQTGLEVRSGLLRFRVSGMDQTEYVTACFFLGDPDTPPDPSEPATFPHKLLQPFQLLDRLRFIADKDPAGPLYGTLVVEKK
jgi:hypothetical protein